MKSFCLFWQKPALHNLKTGKDVLRGVPLLDFHGIRLLLSGHTMQADSRLQNSQFFFQGACVRFSHEARRKPHMPCQYLLAFSVY